VQTQLALEGLRQSMRSVTRPYLLPLLGFVMVTAAVFAPLVTHLSSGVLRGPTDGAQVIRQLWLLQRLDESPFTADRDPLLGAPEGVPLSPAIDLAQPLQPAAGWSGSYIVGEATAFNLFLLAGFVLTALATYILLTRLKLQPLAAFFGALVVAFNPWMVERALEGHAAFVHAWPLVLVVGALTALHLTRSPRNAALAGAALALCFLTAAYFGLLAALVAVVFLGVILIQTNGRVERLWVTSLMSIGALTALVLLLPAAIAYTRNRQSVDAVAGHSSDELASYSATISSYLRPSAQHPILGTLGIDTVVGSGNGERVLYFGFATLALAALGTVMLLRRPSPIKEKGLRFVLAGMAVLAPVAFTFSMPPNVVLGGVEIPLPSALLGEVTSFYRVYARFGLLFGIAIAFLATAAIGVLLKGPRRHIVVGAVGMMLVLFELLPGVVPVWSPAPRAQDRWLLQQPAGIVANYPMPTDKVQALELALEEQFLQRFHAHPLFTLISGGTGGTREHAIRIVTRYVTTPETPGILAAEGVKYVFLHDDVYRKQGEEPPPVPEGFRLAGRFGGVRLLELEHDVAPVDVDAVLEQQAAAIAAVQGLANPHVELGAGLSTPLAQPAGGWRRLDREGSLRLESTDVRVKRALLLMNVMSPEGPQTIRAIAPSGEVVSELAVGREQATIALGPLSIAREAMPLRLRVTQPLLIASPSAQALADFSVSLRERR
jgi:hypothetical protein